MSPLYEKIYAAVRSVPSGRVASYGLIALMTGNPRRSRVVGYALSACTDKTVPCHRIVHKDGSLPKTFGIGGKSLQSFLLSQEGVEISENGTVDMEKYQI
ncbi:MAG: MGMT family protein [Oscillospiraceae bacterium]